MNLIVNFIGIVFMAALASSGFLNFVSVIYIISAVIFILMSWYSNSCATRNLKLYKEKSKFSIEMDNIIQKIIDVDFQSRIVHVVFSHLIHATIVFLYLDSMIIIGLIIINMFITLSAIIKFMEIIKYVKYDSSNG